jgi:hypothetical protein
MQNNSNLNGEVYVNWEEEQLNKKDKNIFKKC